MIMLRKAALVAVLLSSCAFAHAEWLYWTLNFTSATGTQPPWASEGSAPSRAWLVARNESGDTINYSTYLGGDENEPAASTDLTDLWAVVPIAMETDMSDPGASYYFYIELGNALGEAAWVSEGKSYNVAQNAGHIAADAMQAVDLTAWTPTTWTPAGVPEPTSGLLVLMGMGLLALRRRTDVRA